MGAPAKALGASLANPFTQPVAGAYFAYKGAKKLAGWVNDKLTPDVPGVAAPPPPPDESKALFNELARQKTQREIRKSRGITAALTPSAPPSVPSAPTRRGW